MALEKTWRWFGESDSISLPYLRQMGVEGVVTSLYHIPVGEVWQKNEIMRLKTIIEGYGLRWSVIESLPVSEGIKTHSSDYRSLIKNYNRSIINLGDCGIDTVCYNFMPVLDWARTNLYYRTEQCSESMLFDYPTFAAFDRFILKRKEADKDYPEEILRKSEEIFKLMSQEAQGELAYNIIIKTQAFVHGVVEQSNNYEEKFLQHLKVYKHIDANQLRNNLFSFLHDVIPIAEKAGVNMCIHPDDPPFPLLGLPRIASTLDDFIKIIQQYDSVANGITFCTGSLSSGNANDVVKMAQKLAHRVNFIHLRNTVQLPDNSFYESGHLSGCVDMYAIVKILLEEQINRINDGRTDIRMPFRPDHGLRILDDFNREANPGYPLIGRLKGLAEIDGLQTGIERNLLHV
ncbi:mannonate dehydratase [Dysgonomonas sp. Marseille-P4677]|uniref:mannonate dehydratase n=1 Tax=Dysgonomonas sp. Marseille-P4677 TaxID=2364790 RepID=UPI001914AB83|nr:mannonate dehydratase [Dysgonomonas sp. Marseille-P4677]MBK5719851.1 mannonate dehydratase [Dysgonomonas sp. Marseille-P4677]